MEERFRGIGLGQLARSSKAVSQTHLLTIKRKLTINRNHPIQLQEPRSSGFLKLWRLLASHPLVYLAMALAFESLAAVVLSRGPHGASLLQVQLGVRDLVATGRIHSSFLPIGYPAILGWGELFALHLSSFHPGHLQLFPVSADAAVFTVQTLIMILVVLAARAVLLASGSSPRFATTAALLTGLYPDYISRMRSFNDTNLVLLNLLLVLLTLLRLRARGDFPKALLAGLAIGFAIVVRPNLLLLAPLLVWALWPRPRFKAVPLLTSALLVSATFYLAFTGLVHGRPFYPHNGPYNLYAGVNPFTETTLKQNLNAEDSIVPAMALRGIHTRLDWTRDPDVAQQPDPRDQQYERFYIAQSKDFLCTHPAQALRLTFVKLLTLMRQSPGGWLNEESHHPLFKDLARHLTEWLLPAWLITLLLARWYPRLHPSGLLLTMIALYFLPFLLTNADPRFRQAIEGLVLLDLARMLYEARRKHTSQAAAASARAVLSRPASV